VSAPGRVGRPRQCPDEVRALVIKLRLEGMSLRKIAEFMNAAGYLTPSGKACWSHKTVDYLLATRHVRELIGA
jgi:transposase